MIRYALRCAGGHSFDSWFASGAEFDRLQAAALLGCPVCGDARVEKELMTPRVHTAGGELSGPASPAGQALAEFRRRVEATSEDVGRSFPDEARRIHAGEAEARPIIGEARPSEARALVEEGIPVAALPWTSRRKTN